MFRWLLSIEAVDAEGAPSTLLFSDGRYVSPNSDLYYPRIEQPGLYKFGMYAGDLISSDRSGFGQSELINLDGALNYLADYAVDGRQVTMVRVNNDKSTDTVLTGTALGFRFEDSSVVIVLREPQELLNQPHPAEEYSGSNTLPEGVEGTKDDIAGSIKPKVFGYVRNAEPKMVNTAKLVYQVSSRPECIVESVFDNGVDLTLGLDQPSLDALMANPPEAGKYDRFQGYFRLGSTASGSITFDARSTDGSLAGDVLSNIAGEAGYVVGDASVAEMNAVGSVGIFLDSERSTSDTIDEIVNSCGGFWSIGHDNEITSKLFYPPESMEAVSAIEPHMVVSASRSAIGTGDNGLPIWKVEVKADRVIKVQEDLAGSVPPERAARLSQEFRSASAENQATRGRHPLSTKYVVESCLREVSDAEAVCGRLLPLVSSRRDRVSVDIKISKQFNAELGDVVSVQTGKLGYQHPRKMIIIGRTMDAKLGTQTIDLWG